MSACVKKILWIRPDALGDAVLAASMLEAIKIHYYPAVIIVFCQEHMADFYHPCPYVDDIILCNKKLFMTHQPYRASVLSAIRLRSFDMVFNTVYSRELTFDCCATQSNAEMSVAFKVKQRRSRYDFPFRYNRGYTHLVDSSGLSKNELERYKDFLDCLDIKHQVLAPCVWTNANDDAYADHFFASHSLNPSTTITFFPGAQSLQRIYNHYAVALNTAVPRDMTIVVLGASSDIARNKEILNNVRNSVIDLSGKTTIGQAAVLIKQSRLAIGAETGLAHIACAVGTSNVIILGGGHFGRFMPYSPLTTAVVAPHACYGCNWRCAYDDARCVQDISPGVLAYAIRRSLESTIISKRPSLVMLKNCGAFINHEKYDVVTIPSKDLNVSI
jgi:ADP-heptose:LPS heptosyltransferase